MLLLIDYDNVDVAERRQGIEHIVRKAVSLCDHPSRSLSRARVRIYGGWYEGGVMTRLGQSLAAEVRRCSPIRYPRGVEGGTVLADVELAVSVLAAPSAVITNTFRKKGYPRGVRCEGRPWLSCFDNAACPLRVVEEFLGDAECVHTRCIVQPSEILHRNEQKVVDTMMVADLIHAAHAGEKWVAVATRDDDIWPGLCVASLHAEEVTHLSTSPSQRVPGYYNRLRTPPYRRVHWS